MEHFDSPGHQVKFNTYRQKLVCPHPVADGWSMHTLDGQSWHVVAAWVINHPKLGTGPYLITTPVELVGEDEVGVWVQTRNTKYYLGRVIEEYGNEA